MYKQLLLLISLIFLAGCTQNIVNPENELTFEKEFELKIKACDSLNSKEKIKECKDNILLQQAISLDSIDYCDYSSSTSSSELCSSLFYLDKAQKNNDKVFCGFITKEAIKEICLRD